MKKIYVNELKKFNVVDIQKMRKMKRDGYNNRSIAEKFGCAITTALWHTADIDEKYTQIVY
jgi:hypothetical protein